MTFATNKPVRIFIDRKELIGYTDMTLTRKKEDLTGELSFTVFMNWVPSEPVLEGASKGREVLIYIGGFLAFTGYIDRRNDTATYKGAEGATRSLSIGANQYTVKFTARGKTKALIDSSHQHPTGTILKPTNRSVFETLIQPWGFELQWEAETVELNRVRFLDGGRVIDELQRIAEQCSLYVHETVDGKIKVTDKAGITTGEPIILGKNILSFSSDQAEDTDRSQVQVKGQLTSPEAWGDPAVIPTLTTVANTLNKTFRPVTVQLFGNATPDLLAKRGQYEANRRSADSKKITVDVFHVQQSSGSPWDIGLLHYIEIAPAGVYDTLEVVELTYTLDATSTLQTTLVLSPPPVANVGGNTSSGFLGDVSASSAKSSSADWASPALSKFIPGIGDAVEASNTAFLGDVTSQASTPPLTVSGVKLGPQ
jgi:prophage tail gpP-like protein